MVIQSVLQIIPKEILEMKIKNMFSSALQKGAFTNLQEILQTLIRIANYTQISIITFVQ